MHARPCEISVVIATVGRARHLETTLQAYSTLDPATPPFEVVVVLDGDDDESRSVCLQERPFPISVLSQPRSGIGPAKNRGAEAARSELLVFLNDDVRPDPRCLAHHAEAQKSFGSCVVVGHVDWDPKHPITRYMEWMAPAGHQFNFSRLDPEQPVPWDAVWGAHLAVPKQWLLDEPFDPVFPFPVIEDGEWGFRVAAKRLPIRYLPNAIGFHNHRYDGPRDYRGRTRSAGAAARWVVRKHPALFWTALGYPVVTAKARALSMLWPANWRREVLWDLDFRWNYVLGMVQRRRKERLHP